MKVKINRASTGYVTTARLVFAAVLAGLAFALSVFGILGEGSMIGMEGHASLAASHFAGLSGSHVPGLIALASSVAAFSLSWKRRSYLVAGLLTAAGILYTVHLGPFLGDHSIITIVGPVIGIIIGHVILALGLVIGVGSAKMKVVQSPNK